MTTNRQVLQSCSGNPSPRINQIIAQFDDIQPRTEISRLTFITSPDYPLLIAEYAQFAENFAHFQAGGEADLYFGTDSSLGQEVKLLIVKGR